MHGFQLWVNLPARDKMTRRATRRSRRPRSRRRDAPTGARACASIAGEALGARAVIDTHTPIVYQDWTLAPGADVDARASRAITGRSSTCSSGAARSATTARQCRDGQLALLGAGDAVRLRGAERRAAAGCSCSPACRSASRSPATARS